MARPKNNNNKKSPTWQKFKSMTDKQRFKYIIKERQAERKKNPAIFDMKNSNISNLEEIQVTNVEDNDVDGLSSALPVLKELDFVDVSKYKIPFTDDPDSTKSYLKRLHIMAIELNETAARTHFNFLMNADWSPVLKDFEDIIQEWHTNLVSLTTNKPLVEQEIKDCNKVGWHNFELFLRFIHNRIIKYPSGFNDNDMLTLAKYTVKMYFDPYCRPVIIALKKLFSICVETALLKAKNTAIELFAQELYSNHSVDELLEMVVDLFLPKEGRVTETIYTYLSYSLFKTLLGKNHENTVIFPTSINDWFVQDLVDLKYFKQNPIKIAYKVISLLEHVVAVFNLYEDEEKLRDMYEFLHTAIRKNGLTESLLYGNKLDQWGLRLDVLRMRRAHDTVSPYIIYPQ